MLVNLPSMGPHLWPVAVQHIYVNGIKADSRRSFHGCSQCVGISALLVSHIAFPDQRCSKETRFPSGTRSSEWRKGWTGEAVRSEEDGRAIRGTGKHIVQTERNSLVSWRQLLYGEIAVPLSSYSG